MNEIIASPCVAICEVDVDGLCVGCLRTLEEIAAWGMLSQEERLRIMRDELPKREARHAD